uniref:Candidate secreted effector n=1 Tax=Meloidogyne incognita TaxID=6306 RepID=A0A914MYK9_MELIC
MLAPLLQQFGAVMLFVFVAQTPPPRVFSFLPQEVYLFPKLLGKCVLLSNGHFPILEEVLNIHHLLLLFSILFGLQIVLTAKFFHFPLFVIIYYIPNKYLFLNLLLLLFLIYFLVQCLE